MNVVDFQVGLGAHSSLDCCLDLYPLIEHDAGTRTYRMRHRADQHVAQRSMVHE